MILKILAAIFLLGVCIFIHELGHLLMGMLVGAKAKVFSMGYGKGIWKKEYKGTTYQITAIPLGGYVQFYGGEMYTEEPPKKGDLMAVPPLLRIIPVLGGPFFNLLLGAAIYFALTIGGIDYIPSEIRIPDRRLTGETPALKAGLQSGDVITSINGQVTEDFNSVRAAIALADPAKPLLLKIKRGEKTLEKNVVPAIRADGQMPVLGILPPSVSAIQVSESEQFSEEDIAPFKSGDTILTIGGVKIESYNSLKETLGRFAGKEVEITVKRNTASEISPWANEELSFKKMVKKTPAVFLSAIRDEKYPSLKVEDRELVSSSDDFSDFWTKSRFNGKSFADKEAFLGFAAGFDGRVKVERANVAYTAQLELKPRGLLGIPIRELTQVTQLTNHNPDLGDRVNYVTGRIMQSVKVTWEGMGLLITGRISATDNLAGPIEIVKQAGQVLEVGVGPFFEFMAYISIILMFMNLLPLPVVDGGHVVFFLIEAVRGKPLPPRIMDVVMRLGFAFLLTLGIFVMINDTLRNL